MNNDQISTENALLIVSCAGAINQQLYHLIELLSLEISVLKNMTNGKSLTNDERRRIATMAHDLERRILNLSEHIVTIDSLRRWYRKLIATTYSAKTGRPKIDGKVEELIFKLAKSNPSWGEDSIRDRLMILGIDISDRTISNVLKRNGIPPSSERVKTGTWADFLKDHWPGLCAIDFATFEIPDGKRTRRCHALYAMKLSTRKVKLLGVRMHADGKWTTQLARNECNFGFFTDAKHIIMDRDSLFCDSFKEVLTTSGIKAVLLPPKSPNLNAYIERFIGTMRREVCRNFIPLDEDRLRNRLEQHVHYYNLERTHQSLDSHLMPDSVEYDLHSNNKGSIKCKSRIGNLLNYYYRDVA